MTVAAGGLDLCLVARSRVGQARAPKEHNDVETQCKLQQGTLCSSGDTWMLATCRSVGIMPWDRGDDRRAELLQCYGGVTLDGGHVVGCAGRHRHVWHRCGDHEIAGDDEHTLVLRFFFFRSPADDSQPCFMRAPSHCSSVPAPRGISSGTQQLSVRRKVGTSRLKMRSQTCHWPDLVGIRTNSVFFSPSPHRQRLWEGRACVRN